MKAGEGGLYAGGVKSLLLTKDGKLVVGTGDGTVELIEIINKDGKNSRSFKPSKFPNTPQIFTVSHLNHFRQRRAPYNYDGKKKDPACECNFRKNVFITKANICRLKNSDN